MILNVQHVSKNFGALQAVNNVDLSVDASTIHSIIGPNGAGKTTLFNLITGAIRPVRGTVHFKDQDVTGWRPQRMAESGIARTFQRTSVFPSLDVIENVALAIRSRQKLAASVWLPNAREGQVMDEAADILLKVGLQGRERVVAANLAHGYQRSLDIAIGLALEPELILMDEPLAGMSRGDRETVAGLITMLRDTLGLTVVIVEHDVGMVMRLSDRITVMQNGTVIASAAPEEIRGNEAVRKAYLHGSFTE
ncbi:MAG: ABC transporter ATP-binding protein [Alcaligenaceae bacterium]|nr:ABC transporter ATP-binding protein [Alcaligenaceae bacterium]